MKKLKCIDMDIKKKLFMRSAAAAGIEPMNGLPPSSNAEAASVISAAGPSLPLFSIDYRFPIGPQMNLVNSNREVFSNVAALSTPLSAHMHASSVANFRDSKPEMLKSDSNVHPTSLSSSKHKKRPSTTEDNGSAKKRILSSNFNTPMPRYSFQPSQYVSDVPEAPECPYTFVPEPPLNYATQTKTDENQKPYWRETSDKAHDAFAPRELPKSPVLVPARSPSKPTEPSWSPNAFQRPPTTLATVQQPPLPDYPAQDLSGSQEDRLAAFRARRRNRKKLLARIYQQRRPLASCGVTPLDKGAIDRQLAVRYARKLLSQLTLRWAHRRYMYKWHSLKRKVYVQKRRNGKVVLKGKKCLKGKTGQGGKGMKKEVVCDLVMPPEMKKLMVNKTLGETQLHRAARLGYPRAVAYCLKSGCVSVNARDNAGYTPLHECCSRGHLDIARALLQYGADVNASAAGGIRPLHDAVENDHVEIVRLLLSYGADPTIATYSGLEPAKLARSPMMAEFLQGFFADISGEVDSRPHLPWRFWGSAKCLDPEDGGYDVLCDVPSDPESEGEGDDDFLFEVSDSPHLPTFRLLMPAASTHTQGNYLRLNDILRKLSITREEFLQSYSQIEILSLPRHEFEASATCSPLLSGNKTDAPPFPARPIPDRSHADLGGSGTTDLVRLDKSIRKVLGIETISVR